ncbi:hypothetical protein PHLCEN_2v6072 [Hermanssonia centrifuga]|uniref:MFS general substrate transporter n=1 Tax=Hermanssonia centrifuga TaxID=98765 RepID=A0A2R6P0K7_9APHY|nr:hypothetical protein PHLCEN_2v6072 [Hermanssonia centrifuga]
MADHRDDNEKGSSGSNPGLVHLSTDTNTGTGSDSDSHLQPEIFQRPTGLRGFWYNGTTQVTMLGFVCFMCPGLFNALNGLGAGGQVDSSTSANANSALYATFAVAAFFAGCVNPAPLHRSINNVLGSKLTLLLGSCGYALYIGSYLAVNIHENVSGFVIGAGSVLGVCAGLLWTAQGSLMLAYPTESQKGMFIAIFWSIFNLGGVVGASVSLGQNFHSTIGFVVLTGIGVLIPLLMVDPHKVIRSDGTRVTTPRHPSWKTEFWGLWVALRTDPYIILLFPMFFASNWFYTWQFNDFNGAIFNIRARSLNNLVYWLAQIIGSVSIGILLDQHRLSRRLRAFSAWCVLLVMVFVVHVWAYFYQKNYTREQIHSKGFHEIDIYDSEYTGRVMLFIFCGVLDAMWQTTAYWMMGAMSNDPAKLAHFTGFCASHFENTLMNNSL